MDLDLNARQAEIMATVTGDKGGRPGILHVWRDRGGAALEGQDRSGSIRIVHQNLLPGGRDGV